MKTFRIRLRPRSGFRTPWQADTLFGHMCWTLSRSEGQQALTDFLGTFRDGSPPFVLSDGFPGDYFPAPATAAVALARKASDSLEAFDRFKRAKAVEWITREELEEFCREGALLEPPAEQRPSPFVRAGELHNMINRLSGTTGAEGSLYEVEETYLAEGLDSISVYVRAEERWFERVEGLLRLVAAAGYGKRKSVGKGAFDVVSAEPFAFPKIEDGDGFVSLSNFVPARADPTDGVYRLFVKYGKLGEEYALGGAPFKKPLLMLRAGAVFRAGGPPRPFYGRMVEGLARGRPEVTQYGYALAVPVRMPAQGDRTSERLPQ